MPQTRTDEQMQLVQKLMRLCWIICSEDRGHGRKGRMSGTPCMFSPAGSFVLTHTCRRDL